MLPIKPFRQKKGRCGPASLKMILAYYGVYRTEQELVHLTKCSAAKGTQAKNIVAAAHKLGLKGFVKDNASFQDIKKYINKKMPVIVDWFSVDEGHYSVVTWLDTKKIYLQDPELGHMRTMELTTFKRIWFDFPGNFMASKNDLILRRILVIYA